MKKFFLFCCFIGLYFMFSPLNAFAFETISGDSIKIIDANISLEIKQEGSSVHAPSVFRYCIDGLEFIILSSGGGSSCIQVLDKNGKPKSCN